MVNWWEVYCFVSWGAMFAGSACILAYMGYRKYRMMSVRWNQEYREYERREL
jgi:hypothetical protein